jgi:hypothetical protein
MRQVKKRRWRGHPGFSWETLDIPEILAAQFLVLVTCRDEKEQTELLGRLKEEGRECKALLA